MRKNLMIGILVTALISVGAGFYFAPQFKDFFTIASLVDAVMDDASNAKIDQKLPIDWSSVTKVSLDDESNDTMFGLKIGDETYAIKKINRFSEVNALVFDRAAPKNTPAYLFKSNSSFKNVKINALCFEMTDQKPLCTVAFLKPN